MRGFTLIETLVVLAVLTVATGAIASTIVTFYRGNAFLLEQTAALESARRGVFDAARILREASYGDDGSYPIAAVGTSTITVFADIDADRSVERVRYFVSGTTLFRTVTNAAGSPPVYPLAASATTTIATDLRNGTSTPLFTYLDASGAALPSTSTPIASITAVRIQLMVDLNPNRAPNVFTLTQNATFRNLR